MEKKNVPFADWIQRGFDLYKNNFLTLLVATILAVALSIVTLGILAGPMMAGLICLTLGLLDKREPKPQMSAVFKGFDYFLQSFLYVLVWAVIVNVAGAVLSAAPIIGPLLTFLLHLAAWPLLAFAMFLIVDKKMDFWPASMASIKMVSSMYLPLWALVVVAGLLGSIGSFVFVIGAVLTAPISFCILAVAYRDLVKG